ncbi:MAG: citrate/2-methylcitrate synthase [Solirubrobacteraceae bacterium]
MLITSTQSSPTRTLLSTAEVARRLGVKPQTVYAYVSRGLLRRDPASSHRNSLFAADEVERVATRARRPSRSGALELVIETELTALDPEGHLHYRGRDAMELARFRSFEDVAGLLWDGDPLAPWELSREDRELIGSVGSALPAAIRPVDLIPVAVATLGAADEQRADRRPDAVRRAAGRMLAGALELISRGAASPDRCAAARLWVAVREDAKRPRPAQAAALNAALVLLADHELAASTLATRVAASAWADPYRVVLAGLGPLGGSLHGGASLAVEVLLTEARSPAGAFTVLDRHVAAGSVPGFGHRVYRGRDPRGEHLLGRLRSVSDDEQAMLAVEATIAAAESLGLPSPNVDFGLAALCQVMKLRPGSASTIFTLARMVGLVAHALEEYAHRLRFRPRATYVGPVPR